MTTSNEIPIPIPSNSFDLPPFGERWFHWTEIAECFWTGSVRTKSVLTPVKNAGGIYLLAWSETIPLQITATLPEIKYIGETANFKDRMGALGTSAGFWGERKNGHSGGWRWPKGANEHLWVAFFNVGIGLPDHLALGMRRWMESVALEEYRLKNGSLPAVNCAKNEVHF